MRWPSSSTSSSSVEISSTAVPARACARSSSRTAAVAATSSPRVGFTATSTPGAARSARATQSFCWFPPESARAGSAGRARIAKRAIAAPAARSSSARPHEARLEHGRRAARRGLGQHQVLGHATARARARCAGGRPTPARAGRAATSNAPGRERAHAREQLLERPLPVAVDPGERDELARAQLEVDAVPALPRPRRRRRSATGPGSVSGGRPGGGSASPTMQPAELGRAEARRSRATAR